MRATVLATLIGLCAGAVPLSAADASGDTSPGAGTTADAGGSNAAAPTAAGDRSPYSGLLYDINDLRLVAGFLPDGNTAAGQDYDWNHNYRLAIDWFRTPYALGTAGGFLYGGELSFNNGSTSVPGDRTSYYGLMFDAHAGWAYRPQQLQELHFEGTVFLGLGFDRYHDDLGGSPNPLAYEYGLRVAGFWTFENLWQVGLDLRYLENQSKPEFGGGVGSTTFKTTGGAILFEVGKRY